MAFIREGGRSTRRESQPPSLDHRSVEHNVPRAESLLRSILSSTSGEVKDFLQPRTQAPSRRPTTDRRRPTTTRAPTPTLAPTPAPSIQRTSTPTTLTTPAVPAADFPPVRRRVGSYTDFYRYELQALTAGLNCDGSHGESFRLQAPGRFEASRVKGGHDVAVAASTPSTGRGDPTGWSLGARDSLDCGQRLCASLAPERRGRTRRVVRACKRGVCRVVGKVGRMVGRESARLA